MNNLRKTKKKNSKILIYGLIASIVSLAGGYAIFSQIINVTGTAGGDADFDIVWQNPTVTANTNISGTAQAVPTITNGNHTLNISTTLEHPNAYVDYTVTIRNTGNLPARITNINTTNPGVSDIVITYTPTFSNGQTLAVGATTQVVVRVAWNTTSTNQGPINVTFGVEVEYSQNT